MNSLHLLLRDKKTIFEQLRTGQSWSRTLAQFMIVSVLGIAGFGAIMATFTEHWWWPLILSGKAVLLFWGSFALCTPALLVFAALRGSQVTGRQLIYILIGSLATSGIVLGSLLPISWFFAWTDATHFGPVVRAIHLASLLCAFIFAALFIQQAFIAIHAQHTERHNTQKSATDILILWCILVFIVGVQMSHKIGPWYELEKNQLCSDTIIDRVCLPQETSGNPAQHITISDQSITWMPGGTVLASDDLHYVDIGRIGEHTWNTINAQCALAEEGVTCTVSTEHLFDTPGTYVIQAFGTRDQLNNDYRTRAITLEK